MSTSDSTSNDEVVSQFLAVTGTSDPTTATNYLEMCGNNLEMAVGLYMEHNGGGGGGGGGGGFGGGGGGDDMDDGAVAGGSGGGAGGFDASMMSDIRAPDETRTMRMIDDGHHLPHGMGGAAGMMMGMGAMMADPSYRLMHEMMEEQLSLSAFAPTGPASSLPSHHPNAARNARDAVNAATAAESKRGDDGDDDDDGYDYDDDEDYNMGGGEGGSEEGKMDDDDDDGGNAAARATSAAAAPPPGPTRLHHMFAAPTHLMHKAGGFQGARQVAKDSKRWLLVNIQKDSEFASHALNRDVWSNDLVENLIREGFIFWQEPDVSAEGRQYSQRYHVEDYPHVAIIDPRTGRSMWKKEGWTLQNPITPENFAEMAMDFCSRNSFDRPPQAPAPRSGGSAGFVPVPTAAAAARKRPSHEMSEEDQIQAAMRASMQDVSSNGVDNNNNNDDSDDDDKNKMEQAKSDDDDDDDVEFLGSGPGPSSASGVGGGGQDSKPAAAAPVNGGKKTSPFIQELLQVEVGDEPPPTAPEGVARLQLRMPDGKRVVRQFMGSNPVKVIYAFVAQSIEEAREGREFVLMAGFPPHDMMSDIGKTITECSLAGQAITVRWKE